MDRLRAAYNAWLERTNPLAGLSVHRARSLYDAARAYGSPRLQYTYDEIELTDPVLLTCTERRASAIAGMGWKFRARAASDATLAQEQRDALQTFANDIENLTEALEHLDLAFFRGFAHVQPIWDGEKVQHITLLKSWNFLRDPDGTWYWNPECRETPRGLAAIGPDARLVTVTRRRAIDYPALSIHIRHALGEHDWGRFVERYGIPPADITMAPNATEADRPKYENTADAAKDGRNIVLPNGASVTRAGDTRGVNPFLDFCEYQAKQILILATGGTLATLAEGDTGTLAGNAQENVWKQIVARDGGVISDALNRALFRPFLAMAFPNRPTCVDFELGADKTPSAEEVFDLAAKARNAGYLIAQDELEEASGYTLEKDAQQPQNAPMLGLARARDAAPPLQTAKSALQNAPKKPDAQGEGQDPAALLGPFLRALKEDCKPLAAEVEELLKELESGGPRSVAAEKARALLDKIPALVPSDPTLAPLFAEVMAKAYGEAFISARKEHAKAVAAAKQDANGAEHAEAGTGNGGQFVSKGEGSSGTPSETTEVKKIDVGSVNTDSPEEQEKQVANAAAAFEKCLNEQVDVPNAFHRSDIGDIDLRWGKTNKGLKHMIERRDAFAASHPGALDGRAVLSRMPETIIKGTVTEVTQSGGHPHIVIEREGFRAIITRDREGGNHWFISGYEISAEGRGYRAKK